MATTDPTTPDLTTVPDAALLEELIRRRGAEPSLLARLRRRVPVPHPKAVGGPPVGACPHGLFPAFCEHCRPAPPPRVEGLKHNVPAGTAEVADGRAVCWQCGGPAVRTYTPPTGPASHYCEAHAPPWARAPEVACAVTGGGTARPRRG